MESQPQKPEFRNNPEIFHPWRYDVLTVNKYCYKPLINEESSEISSHVRGAQWLSGRVLDSRPKGCGFEPNWRHCVVVLEQDTFILA